MSENEAVRTRECNVRHESVAKDIKEMKEWLKSLEKKYLTIILLLVANLTTLIINLMGK